MEEDENDIARNLDEEMHDAIDNEEEEEVDSVGSADSCHDTDGDYTGSENEMGAEITNDQVQADRHTDWDGGSRLSPVSESSSSSESEEDENTRHERRRAGRRKRLTASDILSDESDIEENGNEGDRDSSDSDDDSKDGSDSSTSGAGAGISSNTRKRKGGATKNEQITRRERQRRDHQGEKRKRKRKETEDETEPEEQTGAQEPHREPLDGTVKKRRRAEGRSTEKAGAPARTKTKAKGGRRRRIARRTLTKRVVYMGGEPAGRRVA